MKFFISKLLKLTVIFLITLAGTSSIFAGPAVPGGGITFTTGVTAVPTLSGTMLILLSILLFLVAFKITKQKNTNAGKFFVMLVGFGALGIGGGTIKLINNLEAGALVPILVEPVGPVGPGIDSTDIVFAPGATVSTFQLEGGVAFHFQNNLSPAQVIKVEAAGPEEGFICDYHSSVSSFEPEALEGILDCLTLPSLSTGQICGIGCRLIGDGPESIPDGDPRNAVRKEVLNKSNTWN